MKRTSLTLASALTTGLVLTITPAAQAGVTAKDVPSQADIVKVFPALEGGFFESDKGNQISLPGKTCGQPKMTKGKTVVNTGVSTAGQPVVLTGVAEFGSAKKAKSYMASFKKNVKKCASYTDPTTGATVTSQLAKAPKVGQQTVGVAQQTTISGITSHVSTVVFLQGKRVGTVGVVDAAPADSASIGKLAKIALKRIK